MTIPKIPIEPNTSSACARTGGASSTAGVGVRRRERVGILVGVSLGSGVSLGGMLTVGASVSVGAGVAVGAIATVVDARVGRAVGGGATVAGGGVGDGAVTCIVGMAAFTFSDAVVRKTSTTWSVYGLFARTKTVIKGPRAFESIAKSNLPLPK